MFFHEYNKFKFKLSPEGSSGVNLLLQGVPYGPEHGGGMGDPRMPESH